jgi:hypothetical protein
MSNASQDGPPDGYVTSAAACARLGISDRTLRRRVAAGTIEGEYLPRPQGTVLYVKLPEDTAMDTAMPTVSRTPDAAARGNTAADSNTWREPQMADAAIQAALPPPAATEPPALTTRALDVLAEALADEREERQRMAAENAAIRERVGRAEERAERLMAEKEQWALDVLEQTERAVRAEAELQRLRGRRWYDPRTW